VDVFSKSDPEVHVYIRDSRNQNFTFVGKTEMILNNLNPDFTKTFIIDYFFEKEQILKFDVFDVDSSSLNHIGVCQTTVSKIMCSSRQTFIGDLKLPGKEQMRGKIIVRADSVKSSNDEVDMTIKVRVESKAGICCGADTPYVLFSRARNIQNLDDCEFIRVFQTPSTHGNEFQLTNIRAKLQVLCNGDYDLPIKVAVHQFRTHGPHPIYGFFNTNLRDIVSKSN